MLAPFLIMLREGLEAALIVVLLAAYLTRTGRRAWLGAIWAGVLFALALSLMAGAGLQLLHAGFPQKAQEAFEAAIAALAVVVLLWMVFWMRNAARSIRSTLETGVEAAFEGTIPGANASSTAVWALVAMAFFAVAREGLESVVFLLAIFAQSPGPAAPLSALAGIAASVVLGLALYQGGLRLDLRRFFRLSGLFILFVAAGLAASALRSAHEAGLWNLLQTPAWDLSDTLPLGSVAGALLSALLGYHESPSQGEVALWALVLALTLPPFLRRPRAVLQKAEA